MKPLHPPRVSLPNTELFAGREALTFDDVLIVPGWTVL